MRTMTNRMSFLNRCKRAVSNFFDIKQHIIRWLDIENVVADEVYSATSDYNSKVDDFQYEQENFEYKIDELEEKVEHFEYETVDTLQRDCDDIIEDFKNTLLNKVINDYEFKLNLVKKEEWKFMAQMSSLAIHNVVKVETESHKLSGDSDTWVRSIIITEKDYTWDENNEKIYFEKSFKIDLFSKCKDDSKLIVE